MSLGDNGHDSDDEMFAAIVRQERRSRRFRQAKLDQKAEWMRHHRFAREAAHVPNRDDVGRAMLHVGLRLLDGAPDADFSRMLRGQTIELLGRAQFDRSASGRVLDAMTARSSADRARWFISRQVTVREQRDRRRRAGLPSGDTDLPPDGTE